MVPGLPLSRAQSDLLGLARPSDDTVTWTNVDTTPGNGHTVTSSGRGPLKSQSLSQGETFSYTFATAGTYPYYCAIHPDMTGTVTVR